MSAEIEEKLLMVQPEDSSMESSKKPKTLYTREFLLSLNDLDVCKKLPDGFDESLLREFDDASYGIQDHQRVPGSSSFQGFKRTDYGSSPPASGDSGNYSRGLHRWDSRSSERSDTDSDSDLGRRYGQARRPWKNPEHDGLLGSGSFPRPSGYAASASVPRFRPNDSLHLNRSNEPYHPPRPYKAVPQPRRETRDSFNDETFGSTDSASEDRVEEEKKRRAEFELMRKEHHKAFQEKQKSSTVKLNDPFSDLTGPLENPSDGDISGGLDEVLKQAPLADSGKLSVSSQAPLSDSGKLSVSSQAPLADSGKLSVSSQAPPSRPLLPPGFVSSVVDKSSAAKFLAHADPLEDMRSRTQERGSSELQCETNSPSALKAERVIDFPSVVQAADKPKNSSLPDVSEVLEKGEIMGLDSEVTVHKILGEAGRSTSILEKIFDNSLTATSVSTSNFVEVHDTKTDDIWSPNKSQSKFAHWFLNEDKKPLGDISLDKPNDILSLIGGGEQGGSDWSNVMATSPILPPETRSGPMTSISVSSIADNISEQFSSSNIPELKPAVLTCEDLEQSILSEIGGNSSNSQPPEQGNLLGDVNSGHPGNHVDNLASQHLLSLLQRGVGSKTAPSISVVEGKSPDKHCDDEIRKIDDDRNNGEPQGSNSLDRTLTLEALFGSAFMKELHSAQRNSVGSARIDISEPPGLPFPISDGGLFPFATNENGSGLGSHDGSILAQNHGIDKLDKEGFDSKVDIFEVGLPEEDSLISLGNLINAQNSNLVPDSSSRNTDLLSSSSNTPFNVIEKLAALSAPFKDERSMIGAQDPLLLRGRYDMVKPELPHQNLQSQASFPQLHAPQMNHRRPMFHGLDSHSQGPYFDPHLKFTPPEAITHHDLPRNNQFPANVNHPPFPLSSAGSGMPGFDHPIHHQMHMAGNLPPPHLLRRFPGAGQMPPHPSQTPAGYIHEHNMMQGFPFDGRPPNFGGPGMARPGSELGGAPNTHPEALQRLLEMELRANPKQIHPFASGGGHSRAMYGHELETGFKYR